MGRFGTLDLGLVPAVVSTIVLLKQLPFSLFVLCFVVCFLEGRTLEGSCNSSRLGGMTKDVLSLVFSLFKMQREGLAWKPFVSQPVFHRPQESRTATSSSPGVSWSLCSRRPTTAGSSTTPAPLAKLGMRVSSCGWTK